MYSPRERLASKNHMSKNVIEDVLLLYYRGLS